MEPKLRIQATKPRGDSFLLNISIGKRLTLGFLLAALIAAIVSGTSGLQRSQSLDRQSQFYQDLLQANTNLNTGAQYLQLMKSQSQKILDQINTPQTSEETLKTDINSLIGLRDRYNTLLTNYLDKDLVTNDQLKVELLSTANQQGQLRQQNTLADSANRTWTVHRNSLDALINNINKAQIADANALEKLQVEPTNSDALSSLRALIQLNIRMAKAVEAAAQVEEQRQLVTTIISSLIAFIAIIFIGWLISSTIVYRLGLLRQVTQAVEQGQIQRRVTVMGRDEIADVSASVNAMLEAITGLLDETRHQRDALTNAAEHLFSDMRVVSAGDLRINAPVSSDPIGMLANAFNFTVGRFRRFVQRTKTTAEQLDVIARQELERSEAFTQAIQNHKLLLTGGTVEPADNTKLTSNSDKRTLDDDANDRVMGQVRLIREHTQSLISEHGHLHTRSVLPLTEQVAVMLERLHKWQMALGGSGIKQEETRSRYLQDIHLLEGLISRLLSETQSMQKERDKSLQLLDKELSQLASTIRINKTKVQGSVSTLTTTRVTREAVQEMSRYSIAYANDIQSLARQLHALAQEIRTGIISFQLDTVESSPNQSFSGLQSGNLSVQDSSFKAHNSMVSMGGF